MSQEKPNAVYVYHYGILNEAGFRDIRPLAMQGLVNDSSVKNENYNWHVSWFGAPMGSEFLLMKHHDFKQYQVSGFREYKINLLGPVDVS